MKKLKWFLLTGLLLFASCGYSSRDNEVIGQVKKLAHLTPLICPNRTAVDVSLGVMRNGVGSMSTEDVWLYVPSDKGFVEKLKQAADTGKLVKLKVDVWRLTFCQEDHEITAVDFVE